MSKSLWKIVGASLVGKSHIEGSIPCQDAHSFKLINDTTGIAVVCDGAGSSNNSHLGSELIVKRTIEYITILIEKTSCLNDEIQITNEEWQGHMLELIKKLQEELYDFSQEQNLEYKSLACTFILILFSPHRILTCHIGDGRAGYADVSENWKSLFIPFKGEQVGQTVFITSDLLNDNEHLIETSVINDNISSFTLMSDGCELASWECYSKREDEESYYDPNLPFPKFFKPCVSALKSMYFDDLSDEEIQKKWTSFLENGNTALQRETDDKTMILGTFINT
jgi:hypothetical protein